jgi:hypothetical protein
MNDLFGWICLGLLLAVIEITVRNWKLRCRLKDARTELSRCHNMCPGVERVSHAEIPREIISGTVSDTIHASFSHLQDELKRVRAERDLEFSVRRRTQQELQQLKWQMRRDRQ